MNTITLRNLSYRYPGQLDWALRSVSLDLHGGDITWCAGAPGSGTSTLLLTAAGLAPRTIGGERLGSVTIDGSDVATFAPPELRIAYLGPSPAQQLSGIAGTVHDEVAVGPVNLGWDRDTVLAETAGALARAGVTNLGARRPGELSGGETQRVLMAALLATRPRVLLLDEPFAPLDGNARTEIAALLRSLAADGMTVIVACEDADTMLPLATRMVVLHHGQLALDGDPTDLLAGDALLANGGQTTEAGELAHDAGLSAPRPVTADALIATLDIPYRRTADETPPYSVRSDPVIEFEGVEFGYRRDSVLHGITLNVAAGETVGLFGPNGAGKSTLLRLAMALLHPRAGRVSMLKQSTQGRFPEDLAPRVGFLFQQPERQLFSPTVAAECAFAGRLAGWNENTIATAVGATLDELGLSDTAHQHPYDLPLPRRRLVALAAILVTDPAVLLLDEPTAALDAASRERVIRVIRERARRGTAVLAVTHDAAFAHEALDRGVWIEHGVIGQDGWTREFLDDRRLARPATLAVALRAGMEPGHDRRDHVVALMRELWQNSHPAQ